MSFTDLASNRTARRPSVRRPAGSAAVGPLESRRLLSTTLYAVDNQVTLSRVNTVTGNLSPVGPITGDLGTVLVGLAAAPGGQLYTLDEAGNLNEVDPTTGAVEASVPAGNQMYGLAVPTAGTGYSLTGGGQTVYSIDLATGATATVGTFTSAYGGFSGGVAPTVRAGCT